MISAAPWYPLAFIPSIHWGFSNLDFTTLRISSFRVRTPAFSGLRVSPKYDLTSFPVMVLAAMAIPPIFPKNPGLPRMSYSSVPIFV